MTPEDRELERQEREALQAEGEQSPCEREALRWALAGHPVLPLWWPEPDGSCGCGRLHDGKDARNIGKHPLDELVPAEQSPEGPIRGTGGVSKATSGPELVAFWFSKFPEANYGIRVGERFAVLDFDSDMSLARFKRTIAELGIELPVTITIRTGRGFHIWLAVPEGLDLAAPDFIETVKHGNAYVVGPGSLHVSGRLYERLTPRGTRIAPCPERLLALLRRKPGIRNVIVGGKVPVNTRHDVWKTLAAHLHNFGLSAGQKVPVMLAFRDVAFEMPADKTESEAREIAVWFDGKEAASPVTKRHA